MTRLEQLFEKYFSKTASPDERTELASLINDARNEEEVKRLFGSSWEKYKGDGMIISGDKTEQILADILGKKKLAPVHKMNTGNAKWWPRIAAAASIVLLLSTGAYFMFFNKEQKQIAKTEQQKIENDVAPGKSGAILTLSNGKTIILDTAQNGKVLDNFTKLDESISVESTTMQYATLSTPKARTQQLTLVDGSKVWLNSESSIHFPTVFTGNERNVEITGEVYFEIAHNAAKPFNVSVNGVNVRVLGTHFNIDAYGDEGSVKTTLFEGSVKVSKGSKFSLLTVGKQAVINEEGEIKIVTADVDEVIAWKKGLFHFESADLKTILRQLARWYDVEIVYEGKLKEKKYFYIENKNRSLASVLQTLKAGGIKFRIEGKKLFVEP